MKSKAYDQRKKEKFNEDDHDGSRTVVAARKASKKATKADSTRSTCSPKIFRSVSFFFKRRQQSCKTIAQYHKFSREVAAAREASEKARKADLT